MDDSVTIYRYVLGNAFDRWNTMKNARLIYGLICIIGMLMPMVGFIIGSVRYTKNKEKLKIMIHNEYKKAQERGGVASLYYKNEGKRLFSRTFGTPVLIGFTIGLILLIIGFFGL